MPREDSISTAKHNRHALSAVDRRRDEQVLRITLEGGMHVVRCVDRALVAVTAADKAGVFLIAFVREQDAEAFVAERMRVAKAFRPRAEKWQGAKRKHKRQRR